MKRMKPKPRGRCCFSVRLKATSPSDREIDADQKHVISDHHKNLFIEQHKDGFAILRVKSRLPSSRRRMRRSRRPENWPPMPPFMWSAFGTSKAAAA
jgi:hypothetical protein